ncbi:MAG: hypothetical protein ACU85E_06720 [Gammaproteobacteria bacterium]
MKNYKFRAPPDIAIDPMPFELKEPAFNEWLGSLSFKNSYKACQQLFSVLKALDSTVLEVELEFAFLHGMVATVDDLAERLEFSYLDSGFPLSEEEMANVEMLGWTYIELSRLLSRLYRQIEEEEGEPWSQNDKAETLYKALYSASRLQLYANEVYTMVHSDFWQECYQIYQSAEKNRLLNVQISKGGDNNATIDSVFKRILIFDICDTNCFRSREMKNLEGILQSYSVSAVIMDKPPTQQEIGVFQFNLNNDQSPKKWTPAMPAEDSFSRYVNVVPVAKNLYGSLQQPKQGGNTLQSVNKAMLLKVVSMLSKGQKRKSTRFATEGDTSGFIGFNNVVSIIAKTHGKTADNLVPSPTYDPRIAGRWKEPDFDLVPVGDEFEHQLHQGRTGDLGVDPKIAKILQARSQLKAYEGDWTQVSNERSRLVDEVTVGHFDIFNSSIKGYGLLWKENVQKVKIGEVFGIEQERGNRLEIGLVRRIEVQSDQALRLGIELIGLESDMLWLSWAGINKSHGMLAIFIPAIAVLKQPDSIVVANTQLKPGQQVVIFRDKNEIPCRVGNVLHSTPAINHFELLYDEVN